jgi:hypothetical protein
LRASISAILANGSGSRAIFKDNVDLMHVPNPLIAAGVLASTALTDAVYVLFTSAVAARRRISAASWSSIWYLLAAFAVISYTGNPVYVVFAAAGSWLGAYGAVTWLNRKDLRVGQLPSGDEPARLPNPRC